MSQAEQIGKEIDQMSKTKTYKYKVTWEDNTESILEIEAENVLDGHYRIYRKYGRGYKSACYVK